MILTVLGCSGSMPGPAGPCSSYLIEHDGYRIVLDLGTGAIGPLLRHCAPGDVDAVVISHLHTDHWADLPSLAYAQHKTGASRDSKTVVVAPAGALAAALAGDRSRREYLPTRLEFVESRAGTFKCGPLSVTLAPARHQVPAFAVRVESGDRALVYTGDTGASEIVDELSRGADLLLCEAALAGAGRDRAGRANHLDAAQAAALAERAGAGGLVLTHLRPWADRAAALRDARDVYRGPIVLAITDLQLAV